MSRQPKQFLPDAYIKRLKAGESIGKLNEEFHLTHATSHRLRKKAGLLSYEQIDPTQRYLMMLQYRREGLSHRKIAKLLGWSPTTVLQTIHLFEGKSS